MQSAFISYSPGHKASKLDPFCNALCETDVALYQDFSLSYPEIKTERRSCGFRYLETNPFWNWAIKLIQVTHSFSDHYNFRVSHYLASHLAPAC